MQPASEAGRATGLASLGDASKPDLICDNLRGKYTCLADDGAASEKKREASMLFSVAEGHLNDEVPEEALTSAKDALALFKAINDVVGRADSQRVMMHATRMKAIACRAAGNNSEAEKLLSEAEAVMRDELSSFTESGDKRGQAAMLLAVAEALTAIGGTPKQNEALDCLLDAQDLAEEVGDSKLQALVVYEKAAVLHSKHNFKAALQAAKDAAALFKAVDDLRGEGLAWYSAGAAEINCGRLEEGLRGKQKALKNWKDMGDTKLQAAALNSFAEWYLLEKDDFASSLSSAKEALGLYKSLDDQSGESAARCWIIESHIRNKDTDKATEAANEAVEAAKDKNDPKASFWAMECLTRAQLATGEMDLALETAQEAATIADDLDDKRFKLRGIELVATVHLEMSNVDSAKEKVADIEEIVKELKGYEDEAFRGLQFLAQVLVQSKGGKSEARAAMEEARSMAQGADDTYLEAMALLTMCLMDAVAGDFAKAIKGATLAKEMFHEEGYTRGEGRTMKALAEFHFYQGDYASAVRVATEGATLMEEFGDNRFAATLKYTLATIQLGFGFPSEAAKAAMDALKLARMEEDKRGTVQMLFMTLDANNVILQEASSEGQSKTFKQGCEKMMRMAKEAVGISVKLKDPGLEAAANYWVAHLHLMQGQIRDGMSAASKTISLAREVKDPPMEVRTMVLTAHAHIALQEQANAVKVLNDAVAVAGEAGDNDGKKMASELLETIVGSQQQAMPQWNPAMMQQFEAASAAAPVMEYKGPEPMAVRQYIMGLVQNMTGSSDEIDGDTPLMESGIDSLASVELRTQLQQEFRLNLPSTVMFNYPTISTMTRLLVDECTSKKITWG